MSSMFLCSFKSDQECLKGVTRKFQENIEGVSKKFHVACHSSQLPEHKEGLFFLVKVGQQLSDF